MKDVYGVVVVGGGPAGLAAALQARKDGIDDVLLIERDEELGGILQQCIHTGFGLQILGEELTGPEYAHHFIERVYEAGIEVWLNTQVLEITKKKEIISLGRETGLRTVAAHAVVLAMGCRERTRAAIGIPGARCAGIYTAGTAQRLVNIQGYIPGRACVILGSGDIGLIMARRLALEGVEVKAVLEIMPFSSGLQRNIVQCLRDFGIPLLLQHTIYEIHGKKRVEGVTIGRVDENWRKIEGSKEYVPCDTVLISAGLIPENELTEQLQIEMDHATQGPVVDTQMETSHPGIFACGNVLHVNDLVDNVTVESVVAGHAAAMYVQGRLAPERGSIRVLPGPGIGSVIPQRITVSGQEMKKLFLRVQKPLAKAQITISRNGEVVSQVSRRNVSPGQIVTVNVTEKLTACGPGDELRISTSGIG